MSTGVILFFWCARIIIPICAVIIAALNAKAVFHGFKRKTLARFAIDGYDNVREIKSSECMIGGSLLCDVRLKGQGVAKQHAVVTLDDYGFKLTPTEEKNEVLINNYPVKGEAYLTSGDRIKIGSSLLQIALNPAISKKSASLSDKSLKKCRWLLLIFISLFQLTAMLSLLISKREMASYIYISFGAVMAAEWIYSIIRGFKNNLGIELNAFFLTSVGFAACFNSGSDALLKQTVMFLIGFIGFIILSAIIKNPKLTEKLRIPIFFFATALLLYNALFGTYINGSKNWVSFGAFSFQPSEICKVALVFISACSLEKMLKIKNLLGFLGFSFMSLLVLAYIRDFGTALIYFSAVLIILALRLSDFKITLSILGGALLFGGLAVKLIPYITERFALYRNVWEYASSGGYQQTQTMMALGSGGLLGLGGGQGRLYAVSAADTDLVFGIVGEEFGLIFALCVALTFAFYVIYAAVCIPRTRSIYFAVTSSAAAGIFLMQATLNIFGSVDLLPLTGVTLPFISNGGSSMLAAWLLLAFIKVSGEQLISLNKKEGGKA